MRVLMVLVAMLPWVPAAEAGALRALPEGKLPEDRGRGPPRHRATPMPFAPSPDLAHWQARAERLRRQALVAVGLWPMPPRGPVEATIHGRIRRDGYTVEKVFFQSLPGFYVTGSLYRPDGPGAGRRPAVLCPHGHWASGRFNANSLETVRQQIERGEERYEQGGRCPLQARCVGLARLGCVVFIYDLVGYADSVQLSHRLQPREQMNTLSDWGLCSPLAEAHLQSINALQAYGSIRCLDLLESLPDVDPRRIAVTGASGGGMLTTLLAALDGRPAVFVPAVNVSVTLQVGCPCQMAPYLRVDEGNVGLVALAAPRPLLLIGADDWTRNIETQGYPDLRTHYGLFGHPDRVAVRVFPKFPHNYNCASREAMYAFVNEHLGLGHAGPIIERDFEPLSQAELSVWDQDHPRPSGAKVGEPFERQLLRQWTEQNRRQIEALVPRDAASLAEFRRVVGGAAEILVGRGLPDPKQLTLAETARQARGAYRRIVGLLENRAAGEQLPVVLLEPVQAKGPAVLWLHPAGKSGLFQPGGAARPAVRRLLDAGATVMGVDLLGQGEFLAPGGPPFENPLGLDGRRKPAEHPGFLFSFNLSRFSQRVGDVLSALAFLGSRGGEPRRVQMMASRGAGHWAVAALAVAGRAVERAAVDTGGFRFARVNSFRDPDFLPGGAKYLDLPGFLALAAPCPLRLAGEGPTAPAIVAAAYQAAGAGNELVLDAGDRDAEASAAAWLVASGSFDFKNLSQNVPGVPAGSSPEKGSGIGSKGSGVFSWGRSCSEAIQAREHDSSPRFPPNRREESSFVAPSSEHLGDVGL